ncbi:MULTISPECIES: tripartite tricarboxylate transporter substrate binding protein [Afifella]|uniref:tripartite tricarboxylate transporter substrate binding protein n=1 Tax=Afifella TaxID=643217 RepID=UPI0013E2F4CC|nr:MULTISPECIES: tripartite tricarboxylate transporter substrate binding protein [Afifella]MCF1505901.1 tripartite tricarboxylate transporter substrate binding protein [Afifella sp. H1R]MCT8266523.1 tripartite tricarboxylate transporter substrate binding protein [Afifella sp. JA880]
MHLKSSLAALALAASSLAIFASPSYAEYPEKPVEMIVPYGAGGSTDVLARLIAEYGEKYLGQPMVVVNRPGAGGQIGFAAIASAKPDGYTIGWINSGILTSPIVRPDVTFNIDTFDYVANIVTDPGVLAVAGTSDYASLEDFLAAAKEKTLTVSHEGVGGGDHLAVLQLESEADVEFNLVAFNGDAEAKAALMGGHIDAIEGNVSEQVELVEDGQLKPLVVWDSKRNADLPDTPTGKELGYNIVASSSRGLGAPKGMDEDALTKLRDAMVKVTEDPDFQADLKKLNMPLDVLVGDDYRAFMQEQDEGYKKLWAESPWQ